MINNTGSGTYSPGVTISASTAAVAHSLSLNSSALAVYGSLSVGTTLTMASSYLNLYGGTVSVQSLTANGNSSAYLYGYGSINAPLSGNISATAHGGTLVINGRITGDYAGLYMDPNSKLELNSSGTAYIYFNGQNETLQLDAPQSLNANISSVVLSDVID